MDREPLQDKDIVCLGHLQRVFDLLEPLHDVGCARDRAGNRELHFDDYLKLVLLYTWNPLIESVHDLQQVVGLPRVAKALGVKLVINPDAHSLDDLAYAQLYGIDVARRGWLEKKEVFNTQSVKQVEKALMERKAH